MGPLAATRLRRFSAPPMQRQTARRYFSNNVFHMPHNHTIKIANLVNRKGIQFVASILKDKLPEELNQETFIVLKLSQGDKLFRIEKV